MELELSMTLLTQRIFFINLKIKKTFIIFVALFLDFQSLLRKIPDCWKNVIHDNKITCRLDMYNIL